MSSKVVSIDSGSSFMKAYAGREKLQFPAIIRELPEDELEGKEIKVENRYYLVGDSAATSLNMVILTPHIHPGFHGSTTQYVQMCYAFERLKVSGPMDTLVCSLPFSDSRKREIKNKLRERKVFEWAMIDKDDRQHERKVVFNEVKIVPQGVGAMNFYQEKKSKARPRIAMLVDVGSCTTDVVTIKINNETHDYDYCRDACTSIENLNVTWFKDQWTSNIEAEVRGIRKDKNYDYFSLMQHAIEKDFMMQLGDRKFDSKPSYDTTREDFARALLPKLKKNAGQIWDDINVIIFTGGGVPLLDFTIFPDRERIAPLDHWANVIGQFMMYGDMAEEPKKTHAPTEAVSSEATAGAA